MPKIAVFKYLTFFIYAYDAMHEPPHLHVAHVKKMRQRTAKIWIENLAIANPGSLSSKELNLAQKLIKKNKINLLNHFYSVKAEQKIVTLKLK